MKTQTNKFFLGALLTLTTVLTGCQSTEYKQEGLTETNSALVKADSEHEHGIFVAFDERLYINSINGEKTGNILTGYPEEARVSEGVNQIEVDYYHGQIRSTGCVKFNAQIGKTYIIRKKRDGMRVFYWVEYEGDNARISQGCNP